MGVEVIYKDDRLLVIVKPAGLQVHGVRIASSKNARRKDEPAREPMPTLVDWLAAHYPEVKKVGDDPGLRPGIVHRLDKETSGVMLIARTQAMFEYLKALFQRHEIKKTYLALVWGKPREERGTIDAPIGIRNGTLKRSVRSEKMAKQAVTGYRVVKTFSNDTSLLEIVPQTGRTHQIRVHLASIGHPVVGDRMYGPRKQPEWATRLLLHALSIEFTDPDGKRVKFEADPPKELSTGLFGDQ
jgi:23S rRNA pseudouridine1911/1915/1917 synthase